MGHSMMTLSSSSPKPTSASAGTLSSPSPLPSPSLLSIPSSSSSSPQINMVTKTSETLSSFLSGAGAGAVSSILCCPLDVAKVRIQVQSSLGIHRYKNTFGTLKLIVKEEGLRGCFKGLGPALCNVPLFWSIYWTTYDHLKIRLATNLPNNPLHLIHLYSAIIAGAIGDIVTNPFWVVRTRIQTLHLHTVDPTARSESISTLNMFRTIYKNEGIAAFYKGLTASFLGLSHVAIQFPMYEYLKRETSEYRKKCNEKREYVFMLDIVVTSLIAKLAASIVTYPHEVLRARLQDDRNKHVSAINTVKKIVREEGFFNLWSGYRVNLVRIFPATISTFVAYEYINKLFKGYENVS